MAEKFPYFNFFPTDWIAGTAELTPEQLGAFINLLAYAWEQDPPASLPDNEATLARLAGLTVQRWRKIGEPIRRRLEKGEDGRLRNPKQWRVYLNMCEHRERRSVAGKAGNEKRWGSQSDPNAIAGGIAKGIAKPSHPHPYPNPNPDKEKNTTTDASAVDDVENFVSLAIVTANIGMKESGLEDFQPILTSHASRQYVFDWLHAGISREMITATITSTAKKAGKQISSMRYFDKTIREAHDRAQSVIHPDSQAGAVKARGPAAESPQSNTKASGKLKKVLTDEEVESQKQADQKRVEAWEALHPDDAQRIRSEVRAELFDKGADALGQRHFENAIDAHFRKRIIAEHLTPKLAAS